MQGRVVGVDIARFVALAGMMAIHILPAFDEDGVTLSQQIAGGRASALFALLAGVSLTFAARRGRPVPGIIVRAVLIALLGLALGELDTGIAVILTHYGLLFLVGLPFLAMSTRALWGCAAAWVVLAPVLSHVIRPLLAPTSGDSPSFGSLGRPDTLLGELAFTGTYPVFVWLGYLLAGIAVGRLPLMSWGAQAGLFAGGAALAASAHSLGEALLSVPGARERLAEAAGGSQESLAIELSGSLHGTTPTNTWWWLAVGAEHSGTPIDIAQTIGSSLLVLGLCLVIGRLRFTRVLFGAGAMTLTLYSAHVVSRQPGWWDADTFGVYAGQLALALAIGTAFALLGWRGPLELIVHAASRLSGRPVRVGA